MPRRSPAILLFIAVVSSTLAQTGDGPVKPLVDANGNATGALTTSAWLDLRQTNARTAKEQQAPVWIESVRLIPPNPHGEGEPRSVFRIRFEQPRPELHSLLVRLFFDDMVYAQPEVVAWDETGEQVVRSGPLGSGVNLPISDSIVIKPAIRASAIDVEVPGDGTTVRGVYLDWMGTAEITRPAGADEKSLVTAPFAASPRLTAPGQDNERFGTVTASLAEEIVPLGLTYDESASFEFALEAQPLLALLTFEVAAPQIDSPPQVLVNGAELGYAALLLPDLADPGYRGQMTSLVPEMQFQYTGWVRAQKVVPAAYLRAGTNSIVIMGGGAKSAIRATQIQLKYLWEKSDYLLRP